MPVPKRYFHCSQELNNDAELWEFTREFGDRALRTWLQILVFLDRSENQWRLSGDWLGTLSRMVRQSSANCSRQVAWLLAKQWLVSHESSPDGSPLILKSVNWAKYNRSREHKGSKLTPDTGTQRERVPHPSYPTPTPNLPIPTPTPKIKKEKRIKSCNPPTAIATAESAATWNAYEEAYRSRYGVLPIRNVKVNSCLKSFMSRVPEKEAPDIASFYVRHPGAYYVSRGHPIELLLRDAEKIRTEWASNRPITQRQAQQSDGQAARGQIWKELIDEAEAKKGTA